VAEIVEEENPLYDHALATARPSHPERVAACTGDPACDPCRFGNRPKPLTQAHLALNRIGSDLDLAATNGVHRWLDYTTKEVAPRYRTRPTWGLWLARPIRWNERGARRLGESRKPS
jgi:hypothetical protein